MEASTAPTNGKRQFDFWLKVGQVLAPVFFALVVVWLHTQNKMIHQTPKEKLEQTRAELSIALAPIVRDLAMIQLKIDAGVLPIAEVKIEALYEKLSEMEARLLVEIEENRRMIREVRK